MLSQALNALSPKGSPVSAKGRPERESPSAQREGDPAHAYAEASPPLAVKIEGLRKSFGTLEVLKGISLDAHEGDVISILGSSGSGKSTLLRCINMLETPTAGKVSIYGETIRLVPSGDGMRPESMGQVDAIRSRIGMVFQSFNLWSHMTVLENVIEAPIHVQRRPRAECVAEGEALLEKVGIAEKRNTTPRICRGGSNSVRRSRARSRSGPG